MWYLLRFLRRLAVPACTLALLNGLWFLLTEQYAQLRPLREPFALLAAGLSGVWAARTRLGRPWPVELTAGATAGLIVGGFQLLLGHYLAGLPLGPELLLLARAVMAGAIGALVSRLLSQRVAL
jgi:hypothetical protein